MANTPTTDALALRDMASSFDAQRGRLPVLGDAHRSPEPTAVCRLIADLGELTTQLSDEVLTRATAPDRAPHSHEVITAFASAVEPAGEAVTALGAVNHQLAVLAQTEPSHDHPWVREARESAVHVIEDALATANNALHDAATWLHAASTTLSPPSVRLRAALSRSHTTASTTPPPAPAKTASATAGLPASVRGR
ncbi:hypothetical protein ACFYYH_08830 [Streptomyces sp. NPDC002018]|uniref:hypothetical protein n=1 Tax=Streptomyces sp. NPDC002018 TaxID=3364629 RepID=UPI0036BC4D39